MLALLVPALLCSSGIVVAERMGTIILSALVAHTAWHWITERWERLRQFEPPGMNLLVVARGLRWLMAAVLIGGLLWLIAVIVRRKNHDPAVN